MLNRSKWCSEMYKNDVPPQAMNNSETFTVSESIKRVLPYTAVCRLVNGNVLTYPAFNGRARKPTNVFMAVLWVQLLQIDFSRFGPRLLLQPSSPTNYLPPCWLTCGLQMAVLCRAARTGATVPCAKQLSQFATWRCHSNASHSARSPCLWGGGTEDIHLSVCRSKQIRWEIKGHTPRKASKCIKSL